MSSTIGVWLYPSLLLLCFVLTIVLWAVVTNLKAKLQSSLGLIKDLHSLVSKQAQHIESLESALAKSNNKVDKVLVDYASHEKQTELRINKIQDTVERIEEQDPNLKMYSKASKLVAQGASMEDVIEASGLPRAEVEVLMSLQSKK